MATPDETSVKETIVGSLRNRQARQDKIFPMLLWVSEEDYQQIIKRGKWLCSMNGVNSVSFVLEINTRNDNLLRGIPTSPISTEREVGGGGGVWRILSGECRELRVTKPLMASARILEGWALGAFTVHTGTTGTSHHRHRPDQINTVSWVLADQLGLKCPPAGGGRP